MASDDIETQRQHVRYVVTAKLHNACLNPDRHGFWGGCRVGQAGKTTVRWGEPGGGYFNGSRAPVAGNSEYFNCPRGCAPPGRGLMLLLVAASPRQEVCSFY